MRALFQFFMFLHCFAAFAQVQESEFSEIFMVENESESTNYRIELIRSDTLVDTLNFLIGGKELTVIEQLIVEENTAYQEEITLMNYTDSTYRRIKSPLRRDTVFKSQITYMDTIRDPDAPWKVLAVDTYVEDSVTIEYDTILPMTVKNYTAFRNEITSLVAEQHLLSGRISLYSCFTFSTEKNFYTESEFLKELSNCDFAVVRLQIATERSIADLFYSALFIK